MRMQRSLLLAYGITCAYLFASVSAQLSAPVAHDGHISVDGNKFLTNEADLDNSPDNLEEEVPRGVCPQNIELKWQSEVSSSVYATPLITDLYSDGRKDVIVPSFVHYLEVLEGDSGAQAVGWPAFHKSSAHASPLLYDADLDGVRDILLATYEGEVLFFKDTGELLSERLVIPRLKLRREWFKGLDPDPINHDHPDVWDDSTGGTGSTGGHGGAHGGAASKGQGWRSKRAAVAGTPVPPGPQAGSTGADSSSAGGGAGGQSSMSANGEAKQKAPLSSELAQQLAQYRQRMADHLQKYGPAALRQLLRETEVKSPAFYRLLKAQLAEEGLIGADGTVHLPLPAATPSPPPPGALPLASRPPLTEVQQGKVSTSMQQAAGGQRRRLLQQDAVSGTLGRDGQGQEQGQGLQGLVPGVEGNPQGDLTEEAAASFDVFKDTDPQHLPYYYDDVDPKLFHDAISPRGGSQGKDGAISGGQEQEDKPFHSLASLAAQLARSGHATNDAGDALQLPDGEIVHKEQLGRGAGEGDMEVALDVGAGLQRYGQGGEAQGIVYGRDELDIGGLDIDNLDAMGSRGAGGRVRQAYAYDEFGDRYKLDAIKDALSADDIGMGSTVSADQAADLADITSMLDAGLAEQEGASEQELHELDLAKEHYDHLFQDDYSSHSSLREEQLARFWQDEDFKQALHHNQDEFVFVDAHVMTTPAIADIDGDGHEELVLSVSYFYDKEYYDHPDRRAEVKDLDLSKYIASGVVAFDLRTRQMRWQQHLDLSTDDTQWKAYAYASPTLVDMDRDSRMEIVVGTSMGFLYVLDHMGQALEGWPLQMGEIQGQALVLDLNNDGHVEICAADTRGNIAAFNIAGEEVWSRHVKSMIAQAPMAGDINNDGDIEVVFGTSSGHIYVLAGTTGADVAPFPFRTHGRVHAPVLITRLADGPQQHLIVMSFDGYLYMVDGMSGCADTVDIGESSYSMVLAEDLDGNGRLDLLVSTMNGVLYAFETPSEYHPLKTWPSQVMGPNGMLARHDLVGIYATQATRKPRDVAGQKLQVKFHLVDKRGVIAPNGSVLQAMNGPYNVTVLLKGVGVAEMNAGVQPVIGVADTIKAPGTYVFELWCPRTRSTATVHIEMLDAHGLALFDEFALSFHLHFHKLLKWLVALPMLLMVAILMAFRAPGDDGEGGLSLSAALPLTEHSGNHLH